MKIFQTNLMDYYKLFHNTTNALMIVFYTCAFMCCKAIFVIPVVILFSSYYLFMNYNDRISELSFYILEIYNLILSFIYLGLFPLYALITVLKIICAIYLIININYIDDHKYDIVFVFLV